MFIFIFNLTLRKKLYDLLLSMQICSRIGGPESGLVGHECCSHQWTKYFASYLRSGTYWRFTRLVISLSLFPHGAGIFLLLVWLPCPVTTVANKAKSIPKISSLLCECSAIRNRTSPELYLLHFRCEPFDTYPRTYDLLHAVGLLTQEDKRSFLPPILWSTFD